jgi:hypothetical protein
MFSDLPHIRIGLHDLAHLEGTWRRFFLDKSMPATTMASLITFDT